MVKAKKIKTVTQKEFDALYNKKTRPGSQSYKALFKNVLNHLSDFTVTPSFWFIADIRENRILEVGGDCAQLSPLSEEEWLQLPSANGMKPLFHPDDTDKMMAYIVYFAGYVSKKKDVDKGHVKASFVFRMLDAKRRFGWRMMQYPKIHFEDGWPRYLLCLVSDYHHILKNETCTMFIMDRSNGRDTLYYCEDENLKLKPVQARSLLSERELEVVKLLAEGLISKEIAVRLGISKNTVENHKQNIFAKTNSRNVADLIGFAHRFLLG